MTREERRVHLNSIRAGRIAKLPKPEERFWKYVNKTETCWLWTGALFDNGYGAFSVNRKSMKAHRFSWELHYGPIQDGQRSLHKCDVRKCVRPDHLFLGTDQENVADRVLKGRSARGEQSGPSKLSAQQVVEIKRLLSSGIGQREIARRFNVCKSTIGNIRCGHTWGHVLEAI